jgi:hypothetical protein
MSKVAEIKALRKKGLTIHQALDLINKPAAEAKAIVDLCKVAGLPGEAAAFIQAKMSVASVRDALLASRATAADVAEIDIAPPVTPTSQSHKAEWKELQAKVKASIGLPRHG